MSTVEIEGVSRAVNRLVEDFAAVELHFTWWGTNKTLTDRQKQEVAAQFGTTEESINATKKLVDDHPKYRALTSIRNQVKQYWKSMSLPFPEKATRMIRIQDVPEFEVVMESYATQLQYAVDELDNSLEEFIDEQRKRLVDLFDRNNYPSTFQGMFGFDWQYPNCQPPEYLRMVSPGTYEMEHARMQLRFQEAVELAEAAFLEQFKNLVDHMIDKMTPNPDGTKKQFREPTVANFKDFFERFQMLNVGSSDELDQLVSQAQQLLEGVAYEDLRDSRSLRQDVLDGIERISDGIGGLIIDAPRRTIG